MRRTSYLAIAMASTPKGSHSMLGACMFVAVNQKHRVCNRLGRPFRDIGSEYDKHLCDKVLFFCCGAYLCQAFATKTSKQQEAATKGYVTRGAGLL